jgi:glycosyltransferase involved in cell wall biosynthesis
MFSRIQGAALNFLYTGDSVLRIRNELERSITPEVNAGIKQLLIDVSVISQNDARTGIQRVVRSFLKQLLDNPPDGYEVRPVYASTRHEYRYAFPNIKLLPYSNRNISTTEKRLTVSAGDIFLGLDLATNILSKHQNQLEDWKRRGVKIHIVVYDLLPVLRPEWFRDRTMRSFYRWLRSVAIVADSTICISKAVKEDLQQWLTRKYFFQNNVLPISVISLGADIKASMPSKGLPDNACRLLEIFATRPTALMVGTIEPRKGHAQVLDAFEQIWLEGMNVNLLIVGKPGWKTEAFQKRLLNHPRLMNNLFWLNDVTDEFLEKIYAVCYGLILAAEGEGFGLPLVEALNVGKPILARNIPVYQENATDSVCFFEDIRGSQGAEIIKKWLSATHKNAPSDVRSEAHHVSTWLHASVTLLNAIGLRALNKD